VAEGSALTLNELLSRARFVWHGVRLNQPDWSDHSHSLAFTLRTVQARFLVHAMFNAYWEPLTFELPPVPPDGDAGWRRLIDTSLPSPDDICPPARAPVLAQTNYQVRPRSMALVVLVLGDLSAPDSARR
jgi:glycogen operon protein